MRILFRILLISLIFGCKNRTYFSDSNETIDTLKYSYKGFNNGGSLYLLNNGKFIHTKFVYGCTGGGEIKQFALKQHKENLESDSPPSKTGAPKKADEVAKVITDHIVRGNEIKLLTPPAPEKDNEIDISTELRTETAIVRKRWTKLEKKEQQLLLEKYTIKEEEE